MGNRIKRWLRDVSTLSRMDHRIRTLETRIADLTSELGSLKSSLDVPPQLIEEFGQWENTEAGVPAEPLISVCVATYNRARLLTDRCLPSILRQTYRRLEVIVVGDGCTDETERRVAQIADPRLRFVNLPARGVYPNAPLHQWMVAGTDPLNAALDLVRGDFVTHLDDDDEYLPHRVDRLVTFAKDTGCDFSWHPFWWEDAQGTWRLNQAPDFGIGHVTTSSVFYRAWFTRIKWDRRAYLLMEPGDWNRFRKIKYLGPALARYPEPLLRHYRQHECT